MNRDDAFTSVNNQQLSSNPTSWLRPTSIRSSALAASWTSSAMVSPIATIADRGCSADLIGKEAAELLVQEGVVDAIHLLQTPVVIQFGVEEAKVTAKRYIRGQGLIGDLYVVEEGLAQVLISDITFTSKGWMLIQDDEVLLGVRQGQIIVLGRRDAKAATSDPAAMWQMDLRDLMQRPDPRLLSPPSLLHSSEDSMLCAAARPTFTAEQVRGGRKVLKNMGISPFTLAVTLERNAIKNTPIWLTPALLRAIGHARGNVPGVMSTARKHPMGGTGIRSTKPGEVLCWDIYGKYPESTWGCTHGAGMHDEATGYADGYGLVSKADLANAIVMACQLVEAYGKGPVRMIRFDKGSEATAKDGTWTESFRTICARYHLVLCTSAPGDQATNPHERYAQTIKHRMVNMFLQQDKLTKREWLLVWMAAQVLSRCVCSKDNQKTPCEELTGIVPDMEHVSEFHTGQLVICPRPSKQGLFEPGWQVGVHICPVLASKAHLVLLEGQSTPQVRSRLRPVGMEVKELSDAERQRLAPTWEGEELVDFQSRAQKRFALKKLIQDYDEGADLEVEDNKPVEEESAGQALKRREQAELRRYSGPVRQLDPGRRRSEPFVESGGEPSVPIGTLIAKYFLDVAGKRRLFFGRVIGFAPMSQDGPAAYRVLYTGDDQEDDDEEDLDEGELQVGMREWAKEEVRRRKRGQEMPVIPDTLIPLPLPLPQGQQRPQQQQLQQQQH